MDPTVTEHERCAVCRQPPPPLLLLLLPLLQAGYLARLPSGLVWGRILTHTAGARRHNIEREVIRAVAASTMQLGQGERERARERKGTLG